MRVRVSARGLATINFAGLIAGSASPTTLDLPWGVTVTGTVRSNTRKPIAGVDVRAVPDVTRSVENFTGWVDGTTDGAGKFTLYNVPANDEYTLCVKMDSLVKFNIVSSLQKIRTRRNDTSIQDVDMVVTPAAIIRGEVTLTDGKKLPSGTHMSLGRKEVADTQQVTVSSAGKFEFRGVPQEEKVRLSIRVPGYHKAGEEKSTSLSARLETKVSALTNKKTVFFSLAPNSKVSSINSQAR